MISPPTIGGIIPRQRGRGKMRPVFDVVVIGAGMAGASIAANLSAHRRVALVEAEEAAGYHTTGRSAALWTANYGPPDVRIADPPVARVFRNAAGGFRDRAVDAAAAGAVSRHRRNNCRTWIRLLAEGSGLRRSHHRRSRRPCCPRCARTTSPRRRSRTTRSTWMSARSIKGSSGNSAPGTVCWHCAAAPDGSRTRPAPGMSRRPRARCSRPASW